jgi:hypothetical protein
MDEVVLALFGHRPKDAFWIATWHNLADRFGVDATAALEQVCVDRMRQRKNAGNVRRWVSPPAANVPPGTADVAPGDQKAGIDRSAVGRT